MFRDHVGAFICLIIAFFCCCITPFANMLVNQELQDRRNVIADVDNFVDSVVDSRQITEPMLKEFNTKLASYSLVLDYEIKREVLAIEPDPLHEGDWYPSYVVTDDNMHYNQGDHISVHVRNIGYNSAISLGHSLCGIVLGDLDETITARVR